MNRIDKKESCRPIFKESGILTVMSLYILEVISYIKKHKADLIQNMNIHNHKITLNKDYHVNYCRNMENFPIFKRELKSFLLNRAFYTIDEFIGFNTKLDV
jgi:hypothetical protein